MNELETIPPPDPAERAAGEATRSVRHRRRRWWLLAAGCLVAMAGGLGWALSATGGSPSPDQRLRSIQEFVHQATSVRFVGSHELASPFAGPAPTYRTEGALRFPGSAWRVSHSGASPDTESIRVPEGRYVRTARPGRPLHQVRWEFIPNDQGSRSFGVEGVEGEPDFGELLSGLGPPLDAEPDRADLRDVVAALEDPGPGGDGTIRARLPLTKLFRDPRFVEAMLEGTGTVELRLTSGPNGRLDRLVWDLNARRLDAPPGARCNTPPAPSGYGSAVCIRERADIAFTGWNEPVPVAAPAIGSVDITPGVDEESLAETPADLRLAPRMVPAGLVLRWAAFEAPPAEDPAGCGALNLTYLGVPGTRPGSNPYLSLNVRGGEGCPPDELFGADGTARSVVAGPHRVEVYQEAVGTTGLARLRVGQAETQVEWRDISEAAVLAALATLGPLDLAAQPVYQSIPPRY